MNKNIDSACLPLIRPPSTVTADPLQQHPPFAMVRLLDTAVGLQRLVRQTQTRLRTRAPHRYRKKMLHLTNIQKAQRKLLRADRKEQVDRFVEDAHSKLWEMCEAMHALNPRHSAQYYFRLVMQASRLKSGTRSTSAWHAFVSLESEKANAGEYYCMLHLRAPCQ